MKPKKPSDINGCTEELAQKELEKTIDSYKYWIVVGLIFALFILVLILFYSDYQQNAVLEYIWNRTIKSDTASLLERC